MRRMFLVCLGVGLLGLVCPRVGIAGQAAAAGPAGETPPHLTGQLADVDAWRTLGTQGCLAVRSAARWQRVVEKLAALGWKLPEGHALARVDFRRDSILCVFNNGDVKDRFACHRFTGNGDRAELAIVMSYIIYKSHAATAPKWNFILVAVPRARDLKVTVSTYHPLNGGPYPTAQKAHLEWAASITPRDGDVVDGLRGVLRPAAETVGAGEDIPVAFALEFDNAAAVHPGRFARRLECARVWDGKYSNGYRNHAFLVETPDGKTHLLRRPVQAAWDKNAPHPVEVRAGKPYVLPEWQAGRTHKSLKALGLDTRQPGVYTITGLYVETGGEGRAWGASKAAPMWGGSLATAPVRVTVR